MQTDKNDMKVEKRVRMYLHACKRPCKCQIVTNTKISNRATNHKSLHCSEADCIPDTNIKNQLFPKSAQLVKPIGHQWEIPQNLLTQSL